MRFDWFRRLAALFDLVDEIRSDLHAVRAQVWRHTQTLATHRRWHKAAADRDLALARAIDERTQEPSQAPRYTRQDRGISISIDATDALRIARGGES